MENNLTTEQLPLIEDLSLTMISFNNKINLVNMIELFSKEKKKKKRIQVFTYQNKIYIYIYVYKSRPKYKD